jgi:hypothetical protein
MTVPALPGAAPLTPMTPMTPLTHLFRHSLRDGRVHPLLHIVQRYRQEMPR